MKKAFAILLWCGLQFSCAAKPAAKSVVHNKVRSVVCPAQDFLSSSITRAKPTTAEELVRLSIAPPVLTETKEWTINGLATGQQNLFLSCYYSSKKIITFKLPLQNDFCMAKDSGKSTFVECVKK